LGILGRVSVWRGVRVDISKVWVSVCGGGEVRVGGKHAMKGRMRFWEENAKSRVQDMIIKDVKRKKEKQDALVFL